MSRILRSGEIIQEGDEWQSSVAPQSWHSVCGQQIGQPLLECNVGHYRRPTKYAPDVVSASSAEPDSGLESVPAVESDTQPRG